MTRRRLLILAIAACGLLMLVEAGRFLLLPASSVDREVVLDVAEGASLKAVAQKLADAGVINRPAYFVLLGRLLGAQRGIQAGDYALRTTMRPLEVMHKLTSGAIMQTAVTIPEGFNIQEIARGLEEQGVMPAKAFLAAAADPAVRQEAGISAPSLEGYLFPSTYYVSHHTQPAELVRRMVRQFEESTRALDWSLAGARGLSRHQLVTLASIIEKETSKDDERPLVASVFYNRLKLGIPLQSDPTVIYALNGFDGDLRRVDLEVKSPYNTYRVAGLPPGPISNPGLASLQAALHPASTHYLYFVSKNDGTHFFSMTLAEHEKAVAKYQVLPARAKRATARRS
ncbi:MAG TPA: endolytic transglycosylase MltG [Nitrospiria bacterium]|nr:endolytic transglycosylase MltG [Nitrospiria bacterium]